MRIKKHHQLIFCLDAARLRSTFIVFFCFPEASLHFQRATERKPSIGCPTLSRGIRPFARLGIVLPNSKCPSALTEATYPTVREYKKRHRRNVAAICRCQHRVRAMLRPGRHCSYG
jgi:hypothetical protein